MRACMQFLLSITGFNNYFINETCKQEQSLDKTSETCESIKEFVSKYKNCIVPYMITSESLYNVCNKLLEKGKQHDCHVNNLI